jgi:hypothetical protein
MATPVVFPKLGVSADTEGVLALTTEYVHTTFVMDLGSHFKQMLVIFNSGTFINCPELPSYKKKLITEFNSFKADMMYCFPITKNSSLLNSMCSLTKGTCPQTMMVNRGKRFLPVLGAISGLLGVGLSIYNTISSSHVKESISLIEKNQINIKNHLSKLTTDVAILRDSSHRMIITMHHLGEDLLNVHHDLTCRKMSDGIYSGALLPWSSVIRNTVVRGINSLNKGDLTPDLLSSTKIKTVIEEHESLRDSIYKNDPGLIYRMSSTLPVSFTEEGVLTFIVSIPVLKPKDVGPLVKITNVGWRNNSLFYKLDLPEFVMLKKHSISKIEVVPINSKSCSITPGVWLCNTVGINIASQSICLLNLITSKTLSPSCSVMSRKIPTEDHAVSTASGVWVVHNNEDIKSLRLQDKKVIGSSVIKQHSEGVTFLPYSDYDLLVMRDITIESLPVSVTMYQFPYVIWNSSLYASNSTTNIWEQIKSLEDIDNQLMSMTIDHDDKWFEYSPLQKWTSQMIIIIVGQLLLLALYHLMFHCRVCRCKVAKPSFTQSSIPPARGPHPM